MRESSPMVANIGKVNKTAIPMALYFVFCGCFLSFSSLNSIFTSKKSY